MPRRGPRRENVVTRMTGEDSAAVDARALREGFTRQRDGVTLPNRSEWVKLAVAYSLRTMPNGWRPPVD